MWRRFVRCRFVVPRPSKTLDDRRCYSAHLNTTEIEDEYGRSSLLGNPHFLDGGDEASLCQHLIADAKSCELLFLLLPLLLNGPQKGKVKQSRNHRRIGERKYPDAVHD